MNYPKAKQLFSALFFLIISLPLMAGKGDDSKDTTYWVTGGYGTISFSQVMLKDWAGGGQSSISVNGLAGFLADYKKDRMNWENTLDVAYGLLRQGNNGSMIKADDKMNLVSKFGYKIQKENEKWYYSALLDFRSQFARGFVPHPDTGKRDSVVSRFLAPGYLTLGLGIDYQAGKDISFNYVPLTGKFTFVNMDKLADLGAYGVPDGNNARGEFGSYFRVKYKGDLMQNINLDSRLELFSNYTKDPGTFDFNFQNTFILKVNKYVTANFFMQMLYDKDIRNKKDLNGDGSLSANEKKAKLQYKSVFGLGLGHKIGKQRKKR